MRDAGLITVGGARIAQAGGRRADDPGYAAAATSATVASHMALTATARSEGDTVARRVTVDGRDVLVTDKPARVGGSDTGRTPHELFASRVAATVRMFARTKRWRLDFVEVAVVYGHRAMPRNFQIDLRLPDGLSPEQRERLERVASMCPQRRSIAAGIDFQEQTSLLRTLERRSLLNRNFDSCCRR